MRLADCLERIESEFGPSPERPTNLTSADYLELLDGIAGAGDDFFRTAPKSVHKFLYYGMAEFDRWIPPTPIVVEPGMNDRFLRFFEIFKRSVPADDPNLAAPLLRQLQTQLFASHAITLAGYPNTDQDELPRLQAEIAAVAIPEPPYLRASASELQQKLLAACDGIRAGTVRSILSTTLPHAVVRAPFAGKGTWRGVEFAYQLQPEAGHAEGMTVSPDLAVSAVGLTRNPTGSCSVTIEVSGLIDHAAWTPYLAGPSATAAEIHTGQPFVQTFLFYLLTDLIAELQTEESDFVDELWTLTPRDIVALEIQAPAGPYSLITISQLMLSTWRVVQVPADVQQRDVPDLQPPSYWMACRRHARGYLSLGATREALLWLNMATEALIDERIAAFTDAVPALGQNMTGARLLFQDAEDALVAQFPDMAGRVRWPEREVQPSRFAQLKALYHHLDLGGTYSKAKTYYSRISRSRNAVIHGRNTGLVPVEDVEKGLQALQWLDENLRLKGN
ncbi:hypothetical protein J5X84_02420 [Streptosporangiaceae bacterium NEAU-GS5]|nr:hypothetical protein [Streptosporangiaceae bacterium NEAU-GS5]